MVSTVLGSCIAVTMYAPDLRQGGMSHAVLPYSGNRSGYMARKTAYFVDPSTELIYTEMLRIGADPSRIEVKVFGGASVLCPGEYGDGFNVGQKNAEAARNALNRLGMEACKLDLGGERGRKILFDPSQGDVWVKKLRHNGEPKRGTA